MKTGMRTACATLLAVVVGMPFAAAIACAAEEQKCLRPEVEQLLQSVGEKLQVVADKLGLTAEQRSKIREIDARTAEQRKALRTERKALLQEELKALAAILTPEQREKIKELAEDRVQEARTTVSGLPKFAAARNTLAERAESAAEKLGLTSEQRNKISETLSSHADRHAALKMRCREAAESEFKAIAGVLNPDQREKAREYIEERVVMAAAAKSIADRLDATADKLGLSAEQRQQIAETHSRFAGKYRALRSERRGLMQEEM
jgi:Spy/CpxP family protein refolding chaperone